MREWSALCVRAAPVSRWHGRWPDTRRSCSSGALLRRPQAAHLLLHINTPDASKPPPLEHVSRWLNRENIQLRNAVQQLNALVGSSGGGAGGLSLPSGAGGDTHGGLSLAPPAAVMPPSHGMHPAGSVPVGRTPSAGGGSSGLVGPSPHALPGLPTCLAVPIGSLAGSSGLSGLGSGVERLGRQSLPEAAAPSSLRSLPGLPVLSSLGMLLGQTGHHALGAQQAATGDPLGGNKPKRPDA